LKTSWSNSLPIAIGTGTYKGVRGLPRRIAGGFFAIKTFEVFGDLKG
jgi:hypothetical protein